MTNYKLQMILEQHSLWEDNYTVGKFLDDIKEEYRLDKHFDSVRAFATEALFWSNTDIDGTEEVINWLCNNISDDKLEAADSLEYLRTDFIIESFENLKSNPDDMVAIGFNIYAYQEEHGDGYIVDAEDFEGRVVNNAPMYSLATNCYYWRDVNGVIQFETIDYVNDPGQHERHIKAGHHVIYNTMYLITPTVVTPDSI